MQVCCAPVVLSAELLTAAVFRGAVTALAAEPIRERSASTARIELRHPTDVSAAPFEKALFSFSGCRSICISVEIELKGQQSSGLL